MRSAENNVRMNLDITEELYACFIEWQKAYDLVNWTKLIQNTDIDWHWRRLISKLYKDQCVEVWWDQGDKRNVKIGREVRQGCGLYGLLAGLHNYEWVHDLSQDYVMNDEWVRDLSTVVELSYTMVKGCWRILTVRHKSKISMIDNAGLRDITVRYLCIDEHA
jgi:hypothetical protein